MIVTIGKEFKFDAAHYLPNHKGKCQFTHGHTYSVVVELTGEVDPDTNMVVDFYDLGKVVSELLEEVDHKLLNHKFAITTVEFLSYHFAHQIGRAFPRCSVSVQMQEGTGGYARSIIRCVGVPV